MKLLLPFIFLLCFSIPVLSQTFELPSNVSLKEKEDYAKYEKNVIDAANWLEATAIGKETGKRRNVNAFIIQWIAGSPAITIELNPLAVKLADKNPEFLGMFMAGFARYALENNYSKDQVKGYTAAIKSIINLYSLGGDFKKNKIFNKALEADKNGQLESWVKENITMK